MKLTTLRAIETIDALTAEQWERLGERARELKVGAAAWETAWLAAAVGQAAGIAAQSRAMTAGADPLAAAAFAGAIAAFEAREWLSAEQFAALTDPVASIIERPPGPKPVVIEPIPVPLALCS